MKILRHKSGNSNMYFIQQAVGWIVVDAGKRRRKKQLIRFFVKHKINPCDIKFILITHVHYDHIGNLEWLQQWTRAKIIIHKNALENNEMGWIGDLNAKPLWAKLHLFFSKLFPSPKLSISINPGMLVTHSDDLYDAGFDAKVIHTPGHTEGSISLIVNGKYAFVGDTCTNFRISKYVIPPFYQDYKLLAKSWSKINESGVSTIYPGHGKQFSIIKFLDSFVQLKKELKID